MTFDRFSDDRQIGDSDEQPEFSECKQCGENFQSDAFNDNEFCSDDCEWLHSGYITERRE